MTDQNILSKKQEEILAYLKEEILTRGFPPSVREICEAVTIKQINRLCDECLFRTNVPYKHIIVPEQMFVNNQSNRFSKI